MYTTEMKTGTYSILGEKKHSNIEEWNEGLNCFTDRAELIGQTVGS